MILECKKPLVFVLRLLKRHSEAGELFKVILARVVLCKAGGGGGCPFWKSVAFGSFSNENLCHMVTVNLALSLLNAVMFKPCQLTGLCYLCKGLCVINKTVF